MPVPAPQDSGLAELAHRLQVIINKLVITCPTSVTYLAYMTYLTYLTCLTCLTFMTCLT